MMPLMSSTSGTSLNERELISKGSPIQAPLEAFNKNKKLYYKFNRMVGREPNLSLHEHRKKVTDKCTSSAFSRTYYSIIGGTSLQLVVQAASTFRVEENWQGR